MNPQTDLVSRILSRIARRTERIARWDREADQVEISWIGASEYRKFCKEMAKAAREKKADLEAELKQFPEWPG